MAFAIAGFRTMHGGGKQLHHYLSADALATIQASGYFNTVTNALHQGDVIQVGSGAGGVAALDHLIVSSATGAATVTTVTGS